MKVLWHHADLKNLQNAIHRDWVRIKAEVEHSLKELDEDCRAQVDAIQHKKGSGSEQVFCSERRIWEAPLK